MECQYCHQEIADENYQTHLGMCSQKPKEVEDALLTDENINSQSPTLEMENEDMEVFYHQSQINQK